MRKTNQVTEGKLEYMSEVCKQCRLICNCTFLHKFYHLTLNEPFSFMPPMNQDQVLHPTRIPQFDRAKMSMDFVQLSFILNDFMSL